MRWELPSIGDTKIQSWFAIIPVTIGGQRRWLERVTVRTEYTSVSAPHGKGPYRAWRPLHFIDHEPVLYDPKQGNC